MSPVPSSRDEEDTRRHLEAWLRPRLGNDVVVSDVTVPDGSGFSNETLLFRAAWTADGEAHRADLAARLRPIGYAVFAEYDLSLQYRCLESVAERSSVPVPRVRWFESEEAALGAPFFVMDRVEGQVPPDSPPYTAGGWLFEASPADQARLHRSALEVMAALHRLDWEDGFGFLQHHDLGPPGMGAQLAAGRAYLVWAAEGGSLPRHEAAMAWLEANRPEEPPIGVTWGDARIGNMMFADFEVAAVLDWEMAGVAPPEVDLGWMAYLHLFFQDITNDLGLPGIPDFMAAKDVSDSYANATGKAPGNLRWHIAYSAMRHGAVMRRVTERAVLFGEATEPEDLDDMIIHRKTLEGMLDGTYWAKYGI
jgi:aminoglycoside phosphotransferase (APT) family kinase protein